MKTRFAIERAVGVFAAVCVAQPPRSRRYEPGG
jgi:hypothetical protein